MYVRDVNTQQWWGTEWEDDPKHPGKKILKECGDATVGKGLFCDPTHTFCQPMDICERHKPRMGSED